MKVVKTPLEHTPERFFCITGFHLHTPERFFCITGLLVLPDADGNVVVQLDLGNFFKMMVIANSSTKND